MIYNHKVNLLFLSPEKLKSAAFLTILQGPQFPTINFACIDEAHCISEWSHNFRSV
jgi:ATP-dependent DNA helicase Q4